jgi:hypothetical protein
VQVAGVTKSEETPAGPVVVAVALERNATFWKHSPKFHTVYYQLQLQFIVRKYLILKYVIIGKQTEF